MKNFALIGAAGFVAPRHMKAIKDTGGRLVAAVDKHDSVGILDSFFPDAAFFTEFERFDRHIDKLKRNGLNIDFVSICSPNYLHDAHIRFSLRHGSNAICEKPLVLNPWNVEALIEFEKENDAKVYNILQLRLHPSIIELKKEIHRARKARRKFQVQLTYVTARGKWYHYSWKGDVSKSGGVATNIGIHFFDMLGWIFGNVQENVVHRNDGTTAAGRLEFEHANVTWLLSIDESYLPERIRQVGQRSFRSLSMDGIEINFSDGFTDLHTQSYHEIIAGNGFSLKDASPSIHISHAVRTASLSPLVGDYHPLLASPNSF